MGNYRAGSSPAPGTTDSVDRAQRSWPPARATLYLLEVDADLRGNLRRAAIYRGRFVHPVPHRLRDVIAFPKTTAARSLFEGAPVRVPTADLDELGITVRAAGDGV